MKLLLTRYRIWRAQRAFDQVMRARAMWIMGTLGEHD